MHDIWNTHFTIFKSLQWTTIARIHGETQQGNSDMEMMANVQESKEAETETGRD